VNIEKELMFLGLILHQVGTKLVLSWDQAAPQVPRKLLENTPQAVKVLQFCAEYRLRKEIQDYIGLTDREHFRKTLLNPLIENLLLRMLLPDKPNSPNQKYLVTEKGKLLLEELNK
jgi:ATP-dependent DNA helicase RecG